MDRGWEVELQLITQFQGMTETRVVWCSHWDVNEAHLSLKIIDLFALQNQCLSTQKYLQGLQNRKSTKQQVRAGR